MHEVWTLAVKFHFLLFTHTLTLLIGIFMGLAWRVYRRPAEPPRPQWRVESD